MIINSNYQASTAINDLSFYQIGGFRVDFYHNIGGFDVEILWICDIGGKKGSMLSNSFIIGPIEIFYTGIRYATIFKKLEYILFTDL